MIFTKTDYHTRSGLFYSKEKSRGILSGVFTFLFLLSFGTTSLLVSQDTLSMTFSGGDIESFHEDPANTSSIAPCADSMSFVVPGGMWIVGVDVSYDMISTGGSWMSEQRSRIWSSTYDVGEMTYSTGTGTGGTVEHERSLTEFNGLFGEITFLMDAKRVWGTSPAGCNLQYAYVINNTWTMNVFIDSIPPCIDPLNLSVDNIGATTADISWNSPNTNNSWEVVVHTAGSGTPTVAGTAVTTTSYEATGLMDNSDYEAWVREDCGTDGFSDWVGPITFSTTCFPLEAGTYSLGGATADFENFNELADFLNCGGVDGHVVINVTPGSGPFVEQVTLGDIPNTSENATVTINGNGNTLQFLSTNSSERATLKMIGTSYVIIDSLHILSLGSVSGEYGFTVHLMENSNHITFNNCIIEANITATGTLYAAFATSNSNTSATTTGLSASNLTITNNEIIGGYYGLVINGPTGAPWSENNHIENNIIRDFHLYGMYIRGQENSVFSGNEMTRPNRTNTGTFYGIYLASGMAGTDVYNNIVHDNLGAASSSTSAAYPIYATGVFGTTANPANIYNNLIYNINTDGTQYGIYLLGTATSNVNVYHNSVSLANIDATGTSLIRGFFFSSAAGPVDFRNNIIHINNGNTGTTTGIYLSSSSADVTSNNNVISIASPAGTHNIGYFGTAYETLSEWQAIGFDSSSIDINPGFINEISNLEPQTGAIATLGANLNDVAPFDFFGVERPNTPSSGAIQFDPPACAAPGGLAADVTDVSAMISWFENSPSVAFNIEYGPEGYTFGSGITGVTVQTYYEIEGLLPETNYDFYIQTICDQGTNSDWVGPFTFSTLCELISGTVTLGTPTSDFLNFADLIEYFECGGVSGHLIVQVEANSGPFEEQVFFTAIPGASDTSTITIEGNGNVIDFVPTVSADRPTVRFDGASYITLEDLHIKSSGTGTYGWVVHITNESSFITVDNCTLENNIDQTGSGFAGIAITNSNTSATSAGFIGHNITITNNEIIGGYYGLTFSGPSSGDGSQDNLIDSNLIRDFHLYGLYARALVNSTINANEITRPNRTTTGSFYGIYGLTGDWAGTTISNNQVHNSLGMASSSTSLAYPFYFNALVGMETAPVNIFNNKIYNINNSGTQYGIYVLGTNTAHLNFYHNTVSLANTEATGTSLIRAYFQSIAGSGPVQLVNNIFHVANGNSGTKYVIYLSNSGAEVYSNNNVLSMSSSDGTTGIGYFGSANDSFEDWQAAGFDSLSVNENPVFQDQQLNVIPQNGNIKEIGADLTSIVPFDITGATRPTNPDPGVYQFEPPTCLFVTDLNTGIVTDVSAWISWNDNSEASFWNVEFGPQGFTQGTGNLVVADSTSLLITGLVTETAYDVYVQANCGAGDLSDWAGPLTFSTLCPPFPAGTYTLGGADPDFTAYTDFFEALYCGGIAGPVVLNVLTDSIFEQVEVFDIPLTSEINTVTINGNGNVLNFEPTVSAERYTLLVSGASHVIFEDLHMMSSSTGFYGWVVLLNEMASHITFNECIIENNIDQTGSGFAGIVASTSATSPTSIGEASNNITLTNNTIIGGYYGVALNAASSGPGSLNNVITNNVVQDFSLYGIRLRGLQQSVVADNDISRPNRTTTGSFYGIFIEGGNMTGTQVYNNRIHNSLGLAGSSTSLAYPMYVNAAFATETEPAYFYNNMVYNINNSGTQYGIYVLGTATEHLHFYHNTISLANTDATGTSNIRGFFQSAAGSGPVVLKNNIFHVENGNTGSKHGIYITNTGAQVTSNHNVISMQSSAGSSSIGYFGADYETMEDWQGAGFDSMSVDFDPVFINAQTNLTPQSGNINDIGEDLSAIVPEDIFGTTRSTTPDPGAIEFEPADCLAPSSLSIAEVTFNTAELSWTDNTTAGEMWLIEVGPAGFTPTGVPTDTAFTQPYLITGLSDVTSYDVYIQVVCTGNESSAWSGPVSFTTFPEFALVVTYDSGDIPTIYEVPTTMATISPCAGEMTVQIPEGFWISTVDVMYAMTSTGGAFMSEQRSRLMVPDLNISEPEYYQGVGTGGVWSYERTGLDMFAMLTGEITFTLDAKRVWCSSPSTCSTTCIFVNNNTWTLIIGLQEIPDCPDVQNIQVDSVSYDGAQVSWTDIGTATQWDIEYDTAGFVPTGIPTVSGVTNPYVITGLNELTAYDFYVRADCDTLGNSFWVGPVSFTTTPLCPAVTDIEFDSISPTSALVSWTNLGIATLWDIEYDTAGFTPTGIATVSGVTNPYMLTDLIESTSYDVYVRADCGVNGTSVWVGPANFNTECVPPTVSAMNDSICSGESALLLAMSPTPGANFNWYDELTGGTLVNQGELFVTPELTESTTYYVEAAAGLGSFNVGPLDPSIGTSGSFTALSAQSMIFEVFQTVTIEQLTLFPTGNGVIEIEVRTHPDNVTIMSQVVSVTGDGNTPFVADVSFTLEPGEYRLGGSTAGSTTGLIRNSTGAVYPYTVPDIISITGNTFSAVYYYYYYNWLVSAGCSGDRVPVTAFVDESAVVDLGDDMTICGSDSLMLNGPEDMTSYLWTITTAGGVETSVEQSVFVEETGTYMLEVQSSLGCTSSDQVEIIVNPVPEFTLDVSSTSLCEGESVTLTASGVDLTFTWSGDVENGVPFTPTETMEYMVTATDSLGCEATESVTITVGEFPTVTANASATEVCEGEMITLTGDGADNYLWSGGVEDGVPFEISETTTFTVIGAIGACTDTAEITVTVNPNPEVSLVLDLPDTLCVEDGVVELTGGTPAGGVWSGEAVTGNTFDPAAAGQGFHEISYTVTDANDCSATASTEVFVDICISTKDLLLTDVSVFPNPFKHYVDIQWQQLPEMNAEIRVIDILGRTIALHQLSDYEVNSGSFRLDLEQLSAGTYIIELISGDASYRQTILKVE